MTHLSSQQSLSARQLIQNVKTKQRRQNVRESSTAFPQPFGLQYSL